MLDNNFCDRTQKPKAIKETIAKMDLKFKTFALQKALLRKVKVAMDWEKISQYIGLRKNFYLVFMKNT